MCVCARVCTRVDPVGPLGGRDFNCPSPQPHRQLFRRASVPMWLLPARGWDSWGGPMHRAEGHSRNGSPSPTAVRLPEQPLLLQRGGFSFTPRWHFLACDTWGHSGWGRITQLRRPGGPTPHSRARPLSCWLYTDLKKNGQDLGSSQASTGFPFGTVSGRPECFLFAQNS